MTAHSVALTLHILAGGAGLAIGPVIMLAPKRPGAHTRLGDLYHYCFVCLFASAVALAVMDPRVWWLALVGAGSYGFALAGHRAAKRRGRGWLAVHVSGQAGSYIAMTTALVVVNWQPATGTSGFGSAIPWLLPTVVGSPIIAWLNGEVAAGRRPRRRVRTPAAPEAPRGSRAGA